MQLSTFCTENNIIPISLYPNSTYILQTLDVAAFHPLKVEWRKSVIDWRMYNQGIKIIREQFAPLLKKTIYRMEENLRQSIKSGFKTCGLVPFNANNIKFNKFFKDSTTNHSLSNKA